MRIFKTRSVVRFAKAEHIADTALIAAIEQAERGLIDADLGGGLIKLRIARPGAGKRGGYRMLIGFRAGDRAVFIFGFAKKDMDNITDSQWAIVRQLGQDFMQAKDTALEQQVENGKLQEIKHA